MLLDLGGVGVQTKVCSKCKIAKPGEMFGQNRQNRSGLYSHCRSCVAERRRMLVAATKLPTRGTVHRKKRAGYQKPWCASWFADGRQITKYFLTEQEAEAYLVSIGAPRSVTRQRPRKKIFDDPLLRCLDRLVMQSSATASRRGRRGRTSAATHNIDFEYLQLLYRHQDGCCALSGLAMGLRGRTQISVDRIDCSKGYVRGNCQLVCQTINAMRNDMTLEFLKKMCRAIADNADVPDYPEPGPDDGWETCSSSNLITTQYTGRIF